MSAPAGTDRVSRSAAPRRFPKPLAWLLKAAVAALAVYLVIRKVPFASVLPALGRCEIAWVALAVVLGYAVSLVNALRWKTLLRQPDLPLHKYLYFVLLGQFFNLFLPTYVAAEAIKVYAFGRKYGGLQENIGIALLSKGMGFGIQLLMGAVGLAFYARELGERGVFARLHLDGRAVAAGLALLAAAGAAAWRFRSRWRKQRWLTTVLEISRDRGLVLRTLILTASIQLLSAFSLYCVFLSLYPEIRFWQVVLFSTIILAALSLPFGFGGVGVREYLNLVLYSDMGGIPAEITFAVNLVGYLPILFPAFTGGAWMLYRRLRA